MSQPPEEVGHVACIARSWKPAGFAILAQRNWAVCAYPAPTWYPTELLKTGIPCSLCAQISQFDAPIPANKAPPKTNEVKGPLLVDVTRIELATPAMSKQEN